MESGDGWGSGWQEEDGEDGSMPQFWDLSYEARNEEKVQIHRPPPSHPSSKCSLNRIGWGYVLIPSGPPSLQHHPLPPPLGSKLCGGVDFAASCGGRPLSTTSREQPMKTPKRLGNGRRRRTFSRSDDPSRPKSTGDRFVGHPGDFVVVRPAAVSAACSRQVECKGGTPALEPNEPPNVRQCPASPPARRHTQDVGSKGRPRGGQ